MKIFRLVFFLAGAVVFTVLFLGVASAVISNPATAFRQFPVLAFGATQIGSSILPGVQPILVNKTAQSVYDKYVRFVDPTVGGSGNIVYPIMCSINVTSGNATNTVVTLRNGINVTSHGHVLFYPVSSSTSPPSTTYGDYNPTLSENLSADGSLKYFYIIGNSPSTKLNDQQIEAADGTLATIANSIAPLTVFWFNNPSLTFNVQGDGFYVLDTASISGHTIYGPQNLGFDDNEDSIDFTANLTLMPLGINTAAPQLANLYLGTCQTMLPANPFFIANYGNYTISWNGAGHGSTTNSFPISYGNTTLAGANLSPVSGNIDDSALTTDQPLYWKTRSHTLSGMQSFSNAGPTLSNAYDGPHPAAYLNTITKDITSGSGNSTITVGSITYYLDYSLLSPYTGTPVDMTHVLVTGSFIDYCVVFDSVANTVVPYIQSSWSVSANSTAGSSQFPGAQTTNLSVASLPSTTGDIANVIINEAPTANNNLVPSITTNTLTVP